MVETQLKSLIPRMRVWCGQGLGRGVRKKDSGRAGRKVGWAESHLLLWLFYGNRREESDSLHIETLHFWGAKWNMWGSSTGRLEHIVCSAYT